MPMPLLTLRALCALCGLKNLYLQTFLSSPFPPVNLNACPEA